MSVVGHPSVFPEEFEVSPDDEPLTHEEAYLLIHRLSKKISKDYPQVYRPEFNCDSSDIPHEIYMKLNQNGWIDDYTPGGPAGKVTYLYTPIKHWFTTFVNYVRLDRHDIECDSDSRGLDQRAIDDKADVRINREAMRKEVKQAIQQQGSVEALDMYEFDDLLVLFDPEELIGAVNETKGSGGALDSDSLLDLRPVLEEAGIDSKQREPKVTHQGRAFYFNARDLFLLKLEGFEGKQLAEKFDRHPTRISQLTKEVKTKLREKFGSGENELKCSECDKAFGSEHGLKVHESMQH